MQSQGIIDQVKHYAVYNNETNRNNSSDDDVVQERAEQEIYLPAFQAAVNAGVDSAMCAYSQPNGVPACQNFYLLGSLDNEFGFQGFVTLGLVRHPEHAAVPGGRRRHGHAR